MERRRRNRHASPRPKRAFGPSGDPDNVIPAEHPPTVDETIASYGQAQMRLDPLSNREFEIVMYVVDFIKYHLGLKEITNEVVALAIQLTDRGMYNRKIIIIKNSNDLSKPQTGSQLPIEENP